MPIDPPGNVPELNAADALDEWAATVSRELDELRPRVEQLDLWNTGLMKLALIQEFRFWRQVGQYHQREVDEKLTDEQRDAVAAAAAFDHFTAVMPTEFKELLEKRRENIIEMLMDAAGHQPKMN